MIQKFKCLTTSMIMASCLLTGCSLEGSNYNPSEEIQDKAKSAISDYLDQLDKEETEKDIHNEIHTSTFKLFGMQEVPCSETDINVWEAYIWQYESGYLPESISSNTCEEDLSQIKSETGFSIPAKITLEEDKDGMFKAVQIDRPSDLDYVSDMEELFPETIRKELEDFSSSSDLADLELQTTQKACKSAERIE